VKIRWKHWLGLALFLLVAGALAIYIAFATGFANRLIRRAVIGGIEQGTGARVEIQRFRFHPWVLRAEIDGLTLHGLEAPAAAPLFHADRIAVDIRIRSFFGRKYALDELVVDRPQLAITVDKNGHSNLPHRKPQPNSRPWQQTLFNLQIGNLELRDGRVDIGNFRAPLAVRGHEFQFSLHYNGGAPGTELYLGSFGFHHALMAERRDVPFAFDASGKFTLHRDSFELDQFVLHLPYSELNLRAELPSFSRPDWNLRYRGRLSLEDVRIIFHAPTTPGGMADFSGEAQYAAGQWTAKGYYDAHDIRMRYQWFHASGLRTWGDYEVGQRKLVVPNLRVSAFDGAIDGRLEMDFPGLAFRTETRLRGANLARVFTALDNPSFPVLPLHWAGSIDADCVNTWQKNFKHFRTQGETRWSPPGSLAPGMIPVSAKIDYDYDTASRGVTIQPGAEISMPKTQLSFYGPLSAVDSSLELKFHSDDLVDWDDFINILRGKHAEPVPIGGRVDWRGRILGPIGGPTFVGHVEGAKARYDKLYWDAIVGDMEYSPDDFGLTNASVRRGRTSAVIDLGLKLDGNWSFLPTSRWSLRARLDHSPTDDLQEILEINYPVTGLLTGDFRGSGTRQAPVLDGQFTYENIEAKGIHFDQLSGQIHFAHDEMRLSHAELRRGAGRVTGGITLHSQGRTAEFNLTGTRIALDKISAIQTTAVPIGGQLNFDLRGSGPLLAPVGQGSLQVAKLRLGTEAEGDFRGQVSSDGRTASLSIQSESPLANLEGQVTMGFAGDRPISGKVSLVQFDLDPFIVAGLHLKHITSHSSADGVLTISGPLRQPDSIQVAADITRISFDYEFVHLTNDQDIRITYRRNEVRIDQARLHGPETDLHLSGSARFDRDRPLRLAVSGQLDLRLLAHLLPGFEFQGQATANVSIEGNMARPRITGHTTIHNASASYADFPVGLSKVSGDFVFDESRFLFDRVTAESGGGQLTLSGNVVYGEGPLRYEVNASTPLIRIRYPTGLSWLAGGTLQLSGSSSASLLSGRIQVQRLLFAQGVDVASFFATASQTTSGPPSTSPFLRNLSFDIEGQTAPGAQIQWTSAQIGIDGDVRLRGTWDHPILLGNIHLLNGQMAFRGNNFDLTRGDINFANPFRLDPVLNVEATATISQYQLTINFSGPASRLSMTYRSDPPLPDSDIIALLALGSPGQEAGLRSQSASSQSYGATALLSEAISSSVGGRIEHLFGISQFRVDPFVAGTATESNAAARVTIQEQVARDLTITYSTNAATTNQYQLIQVQYDVSRELSVEFLRDINGTYGFDIKWVKHFK
jgi:translocation and assembly module TamB